MKLVSIIILKFFIFCTTLSNAKNKATSKLKKNSSQLSRETLRRNNQNDTTKSVEKIYKGKCFVKIKGFIYDLNPISLKDNK